MTSGRNASSEIAALFPLTGKRILITRAPHQVSELADGLRRLGAATISIPTIEIGPPSSFEALDAAIASLAEFDFAVFTSANAVSAFAERAGTLSAIPQTMKVAVVGPATARAAESAGVRVHTMPLTFTAAALAETLLSQVRGRDVLLVLAEDAPGDLAVKLTEGGARVRVAAAYANRIPATSAVEVAALLSDPGRTPHAVTFTSASTAKNLVALLKAAGATLPETIARISIGPITSRALEVLGLPGHAEAAESTIAALLEAVCQHLVPPP